LPVTDIKLFWSIQASNLMFSGLGNSAVYNNAAPTAYISHSLNSAKSRYLVSSNYQLSQSPQHQQQYTISAPGGSSSLPSTSTAAQKPIIGIAYSERRDSSQPATYVGSFPIQSAVYGVKQAGGYSTATPLYAPTPSSIVGNGSVPRTVVDLRMGRSASRQVTNSASLNQTTVGPRSNLTPPAEAVAIQGSQGASTARGSSPYPVVMPAQSRGESLMRGSPSRTPGLDGGATTPTGQSNNHSSPRPSILSECDQTNLAAMRV